MKIPGRSEQGERGGVGGAAQGQRQCKEPAHAIADDRHRAARQVAGFGEHAIERARDVVAQGKIALGRAGFAPIDDKGAQPGSGEMAQKTLLRQQVENVIAVDQRRDDEHGRRFARRPVIEQPHITFLPGHRSARSGATEGVAAISFQPRGKVLRAPQQLAIERRGDPVNAEFFEFLCERLQRVFGGGVRERRSAPPAHQGGARAQP